MSIDLDSILDEFKQAFENANHHGASPRYLSLNMTQPVKTVLKLNPEIHQIQPSLIPAITIWISDKTIDLDGIGRDQLNVERRAKINFTVAGIVWNSNMTDFKEDPADLDSFRLMENIEEILRGDPTLDGTVLWQFPTDVGYYPVSFSEETHYRVGMMTVETTVRY